jgi:iron complex outermembrane receptor protein
MYSSLVKKILLLSIFTLPFSVLSQDGGGIEEVVVTAEKREQNLQDVPSSITAVSDTEMERGTYQNIFDLQTSVPSLVVGSAGASRPFFFIRGVGSRKFDPGTEGAVGVFVDEIYNTRFTNSMMDLVDLDRVEVLKGPQGTLYGRNTIGGAIALYTKKPTQETEGKVKVGFGNEGYNKLAATYSGGITDSMVGRIAFSTKTDEGYAKEKTSGKNNGGDVDALRLSLIKEINNGSELSFTYQDTSYSADAHLAEAALECGPTIDPSGSPNFMSVAYFRVGAAASQLAGAGINPTDCYITGHPLPFFPVGPLAGQVNANALPLIGSDLVQNLVLADVADGPRIIDNDHPGFNEIDSTLISLKYVADLYDNLTLTAMLSTTDVENESSLDFDATSRAAIVNYVVEESDQTSTEIRLNYSGDRFNWVGGIYLLDDNIYARFSLATDIQSTFGIVQLMQMMAGLTPSPSDNAQTSNANVTSEAIYWQGTYAITDKLNATFGVRKSDDESDYTIEMTTTSPGIPFVQVPGVWSEVLEFGSTDPKLVLDYSFNENTMGYVSVSSGYKSGGFSFATWSESESRGGFNEEELDATEIGVKYKSSDNRLVVNAAYYEYDYTDQQQQIIVVTQSGSLAGKTFNAGESEMTGFELETKYAITDNTQIDFNYYSSDTSFKSFVIPTARPPLNFTGNQMNYSPESAYNVAFTAVSDDDSSILRVAYSYKDEYFMDPSNRYISLQNSYGVANVSYTKYFTDEWKMKIFCTNCTDEIYKTQVTTFAIPYGGGGRNYYANARRIGVEITKTF